MDEDDSRLLDASEVGEILKVSKSKAQKLLHDKEIGHYTVGKQRLCTMRQIREYLQRCEVKPECPVMENSADSSSFGTANRPTGTSAGTTRPDVLPVHDALAQARQILS